MNIAQKLAHFVFPAPRSIPTSENEDHNKNSAHTRTSQRCEFTFSDGRQCRSERAQFCVHHASKAKRDATAEGGPASAIDAPELAGLCTDLTTATNINRAVAQTYLLLAQGRISQKQAVAFGYLSQLLLQTVPGIRAEYVSAFGYRSWEEKLKSKLETPPEPSFRANNLSEESLSGPDDSSPASAASPVRKPNPDQRPLAERVKHPDFGDLYLRSLDLLDRKYSMTPEGRREANALVLELELSGPPPAKPRRDFRGQVADLVRRAMKHQAPIRSGSASRPPAKVYRQDELSPGNNVNQSEGPLRPEASRPAAVPTPAPNPPAAVPMNESRHPEERSDEGSAFRRYPNADNAPPPAPDKNVAPGSPQSSPPRAGFSSGFRTPVESTGLPKPEPASSVPPNPASPPFAAQDAPAWDRSAAPEPHADFAFRPRSPENSRKSSRLNQQPYPPPTPDAPPPKRDPDLSERVGHTADWYSPASWSGHRQPDPFPSRQEKLKRELRAISNSRSRRQQHQNQSRSFWH